LPASQKELIFSKTKIGELDETITKEHKMMQGDDHSFALRGLDAASIEKYRTILQTLQGMLEGFREDEKTRREADTKDIQSQELERLRSLEEAKADSRKSFDLANLAFTDFINRMEFEHGKQTINQYTAELRTSENERFKILSAALNDRLAELNKDRAKNEQAIITTNGEIRALEIQHQLALSQVYEQGARLQADQQIKAMNIVIAKTKEGTQERVNAEKAMLALLKGLYGEEKDVYLAQLARVAEAELAHDELLRNLAKAQAHYVEQSATQKQQAEVAYYNFLRSASAISAADLIKLQQKSERGDVQNKKERSPTRTYSTCSSRACCPRARDE
jgi:hypothetical protein